MVDTEKCFKQKLYGYYCMVLLYRRRT